MQEGEEERKDSSEGIWLVLIWKYCYTSSELNYCSELVVLREQAQSHRSPDGQALVGGSVTVTTVCTWTPGLSRAVAVLLCSRSDVLLCYCWTQFYTRGQCLQRSQKFWDSFTLSFFVLFPATFCLARVYLLRNQKKEKKEKQIRYDDKSWSFKF